MLRLEPGLRVLGILLVLHSMVLAAHPPTKNQLTAQVGKDQSATNAPMTLTLQDALARARKINPQYLAAITEFGVAKQERVVDRATLLPSANYETSFLYTQGGGILGLGRFVANNGVHEYLSQGIVHQEFSLQNVAAYRRATAGEALARANAEIAARGLVVTVVQAYYSLVVAQRKYATAERAATEAQRFLNISQKLEQGGEVAHSDVIKAEIQYQQQQRDLEQAELEMNRTRLGLAVLVFPDFTENFAVVDDLQPPEPLPNFPEVQKAAANRNPELRAALAALQQANQDVSFAWGGFLPALSFDYFHGVDANQFATEGPIDPATGNRIHNLGYAAAATLQIPIWNWGANRAKVKQADLRRQQARIELSATQRTLLANLRSLYQEAQTARSQLESLSQSAELAAESLHLTTLRYQAGEATVLEVVDAQNTLTQVRNAFDDGQSRYRIALANLQTLTGTL